MIPSSLFADAVYSRINGIFTDKFRVSPQLENLERTVYGNPILRVFGSRYLERLVCGGRA
jgi:hypothetical protein